MIITGLFGLNDKKKRVMVHLSLRYWFNNADDSRTNRISYFIATIKYV